MLQTTLSITVLPGQTYYINRSAYTALNILFVSIAALAPVVYNFTRRIIENLKTPDAPTMEYRGRVIWFLVASVIMLWAVLGQLGMQALTLFELLEAKLIPSSILATLLIALALLTILLIGYAIDTICKTASTQTIKKLEASQATTRAEAAETNERIPTLVRERPRWALL